MVLHRAELVERLTREASEHARRVAADELVTVLAHDLRAPLTPIRGYLGMIEAEAQREGRLRSRDYAQRALLGVDRLDRMIRDIMDMARLEQGLFTINPTPLDLAELARETAAILQTPGSLIEVRAPDPVVIEGDPDRIRQVLENLVSNALKHTPEGLPIVIEVASAMRDDGASAVVTGA